MKTPSEIMEAGRNPAATAALLTLPWYESGCMQEHEILGSPIGQNAVLSHPGSSTLKMLREAHLIRAISMRKSPRGWMSRLAIVDVLRAEIASALASLWNISVMSSAKVLEASSPVRGGGEWKDNSGVEIVTKYPSWLGTPLDNHAAQLADAVTKHASAPRFRFNKCRDAKLILVDRKWLFVDGLDLGEFGVPSQEVPRAVIHSLKTLDTRFTSFRSPRREDIGRGMLASFDNALSAHASPSGVMTFNVSEILSRLADRLSSRKETAM